jgi:hypothetical protein
VDLTPDWHIEDVKSILSKHKNRFVVILDVMLSFYSKYSWKSVLVSLIYAIFFAGLC